MWENFNNEALSQIEKGQLSEEEEIIFYLDLDDMRTDDEDEI